MLPVTEDDFRPACYPLLSVTDAPLLALGNESGQRPPGILEQHRRLTIQVASVASKDEQQRG